MKKICIVFIVLLVASTASAHDVTSEVPKVQLASRDSSPSRVPRIALEGLVGAAAGTLLGLAGGMIGLALCEPDEETWNFDCAGYAMLGGLVGMEAGLTAGVFLLGDAMHGNGGLGWTALGAAAGMGVGALIAIPMLSTPSGHEAPLNGLAVSAFALSSISGAIIGYELSSDDDDRDETLRVSLAPTGEGSGFMAQASGRF